MAIIKNQKFQFETKSNFFSKERLIVKDENAKPIASFFFNMRGFVPNFELSDDNGVTYHFLERGKTTQIREFKNAINKGYNNYKSYENY